MIELILTIQVVFGVVIALNLLLTFALIRNTNQRTGRPPNKDMAVVGLGAGDLVPQFRSRTLDGRHVTDTTYGHGRVAFWFFSPKCKTCIEQLSQFIYLAGQARDRGDEVVLVTGGDAESTGRVLLGRISNAAVLVGRDGPDDLFDTFRVRGTPFLTLVKEGIVVGSGVPSENSSLWTEMTEAWGTPTTRASVAQTVASS